MVVLGAASGVALTSGLSDDSRTKATQLVIHWSQMYRSMLGLLPDSIDNAKASGRQTLQMTSMSKWDESDRNDFVSKFKRKCNVRADEARMDLERLQLDEQAGKAYLSPLLPPLSRRPLAALAFPCFNPQHPFLRKETYTTAA